MLNHELRHDDKILVLSPDGPLEAADFTALTWIRASQPQVSS